MDYFLLEQDTSLLTMMMLYLLEKGRLYTTKVGMQFLDKNVINLVTSFQNEIKDKCEATNANFEHLKFNDI